MPEQQGDIYDEVIVDEADRVATKDYYRRLRGDDEPLSAPHNDVCRRDRWPESIFRPTESTGSAPATINEAVYATETRDHGRGHTTATKGNRPMTAKESSPAAVFVAVSGKRRRGVNNKPSNTNRRGDIK